MTDTSYRPFAMKWVLASMTLFIGTELLLGGLIGGAIAFWLALAGAKLGEKAAGNRILGD